jgi:hypothetical protein
MQYTLSGFSHESEFRVFAFEGMGEDRVRTAFNVKTDLALVRRYRIRVQELPLLCRGLLERRDEGAEQRAFTYTEEDMRLHADVQATRDAAAQKRKSPHKPAENVGAAWRGSQS